MIDDQLLYSVKNLTFRWRDNNLLFDNTDFTIHKNRLTSIIGRNGVGKTTLLKILCRIERAEKGEIIFENKNLREYGSKEFARKTAYVKQNPNETIPLNIIDILNLAAYPDTSFFNSGLANHTEKIEKAVNLCNIKDIINKQFNRLSGGEKQKVMIARSLCQSDNVILMDEPTSSLDIKNEIETIMILKELVDKHGYSIILVSHNLNLTIQNSHNILILNDKKVIKYSKTEIIESGILDKVYNVKIKHSNIEGNDIFWT